ncbi:hypothetical protein GMMP15_1080004 [Candidatus Magnetomoraceae bacterium gMMP-15]
MVMSNVSSGANISSNLSLDLDLALLCWVTKSKIKNFLK